MLQVPIPASTAFAPEIVHTPSVLEMNVTVRPALEVAESGTLVALKFCVPGPVKEIVCVVLATVSVKACAAFGGVPLVNGAAQGITLGYAATTSFLTKGWTAAAALRLNKGDVFTMAGCVRVHPETKVSTGVLQQFVITAAAVSGATSISISPAIVVTGAGQNVTASPTNAGALVFAGTLSTATGQTLAYHKDAFTFATADLILPDGVEFAARKMQDGISLRIVRQYDISNDKMPCRIDVLYGYKTIRPQLACRLAAN